MRKKRVAVFISGEGTNLQSLIDASLAENYPAQITLVVSNVAKAGGLKRAEQAGIANVTVEHQHFDTRREFEALIHTVTLLPRHLGSPKCVNV